MPTGQAGRQARWSPLPRHDHRRRRRRPPTSARRRERPSRAPSTRHNRATRPPRRRARRALGVRRACPTVPPRAARASAQHPPPARPCTLRRTAARLAGVLRCRDRWQGGGPHRDGPVRRHRAQDRGELPVRGSVRRDRGGRPGPAAPCDCCRRGSRPTRAPARAAPDPSPVPFAPRAARCAPARRAWARAARRCTTRVRWGQLPVGRGSDGPSTGPRLPARDPPASRAARRDARLPGTGATCPPPSRPTRSHGCPPARLPVRPSCTAAGSPFHRIIPQFMIQGGDFTRCVGGRVGWAWLGERPGGAAAGLLARAHQAEPARPAGGGSARPLLLARLPTWPPPPVAPLQRRRHRRRVDLRREVCGRGAGPGGWLVARHG